MDEQGKKKRTILGSKPLKFAFLFLVFVLFLLYILDKYIIPDRVSVYLTREPDISVKKTATTTSENPEEKDKDRAAKPAKKSVEEVRETEKPPAVPSKVCYKTISEISAVMGYRYPERFLNEWGYNIERGKGKKLSKNVYGREELEDWDSDMLGDENSALLKKGAAEFIKLEDEAQSKAQEAKEKSDKAKKKDVHSPDQPGAANNVEGELPVDQGNLVRQEKNAEKLPLKEKIDAFSYKLVRFMPGLGDDGCFLDYHGINLAEVLMGKPDFSEGAITRPEVYRAQFLAFGNGGSVVLEVVGGEIVDGVGPDFVIYGHSAFTKGVKTAKVEVAEKDEQGAYTEFQCDSVIPPFKGCAGVHPVDPSKSDDPILVGGDPFDLARIGVKKVRFIRITDTADNKNPAGFINTDGFNLDSIALIHAFKK